jgi:enoyl-CoA hydratase/carnithine racemase
MTAWAKIRVADVPPVRTITLYNPDRRNAIGPQMVNELLHALEEARANADLRVIVLTGEGKSFCAGGDFSQMSDPANALPPKGDYADLMLAMVRSDKPIIARVNGHAMGGGLGLVAASTFAIAGASASLGTPEIDVGLFPMMIMAILARVVPRRTLLEMMLLGRRLSADEARAIGIVNRVVEDAELDREVERLSATIAAKSPIAIALGLRAFAEQDDLDLVTALPMLRGKLGECLSTDDAREGLAAFLEKRPPRWTGR